MVNKTTNESEGHIVRLWDPLLRTLHWVFAIVYFSNYFINEPGEDWHEYLGYLAIAALCFRIIWSDYGPSSAHWRYFFPSHHQVAAQIAALKTGKPFSKLGHTPLGGLVMLFMLFLIASLGVTGFMMEEIDIFWGEDWVQVLHHWLANILTGAVFLHLMAVVYQSVKTKENYFFSIITGKRRVE